MPICRYGARLFRKSPLFTVIAVATLALGIGANAAIFSVVDAVMIRALPFADPDRLVVLWEDASFAGIPKNTPSPGNYNEWRRLNRSFDDLAATRGATASLTGDGEPEQVLGRLGHHEFLQRPRRGAAARPGVHRRGRPHRRAGRDHQPRTLAAAFRRRRRHRRPDDPDERQPVRGHRRDAAVVRVSQPRDRLLATDSPVAGAGRGSRVALSERRRPSQARRVSRGDARRHAVGDAADAGAVSHQPGPGDRGPPGEGGHARQHRPRIDRADGGGRRGAVDCVCQSRQLAAVARRGPTRRARGARRAGSQPQPADSSADRRGLDALDCRRAAGNRAGADRPGAAGEPDAGRPRGVERIAGRPPYWSRSCSRWPSRPA